MRDSFAVARAFSSPTLGTGALVAAGVAVGLGASRGPVQGAAALLAVLVGYLVMRRPAVGALILIAAVPITSGLRRGLPIPGLRVSELLIGTVAIAVLVFPPSNSRVPWRAFDWVALAYVVCTATLGGVDALLLGYPLTASETANLFGPLQFFLLYRAVLVVAAAIPDVRRWGLAALLVVGAAVSALALAQWANVPKARTALDSLVEGPFDFAYTVEGGLARATGLFASWHALAGYLLVLNLLAIALFLERSGRVLRGARLVPVLVLMQAALLATVSFAPLAGLLVGALALAIWVGRADRLAIALAIAGLMAALVFGPSIAKRADSQYAAVPVAQRHALLPPTLAYRVQIWETQFFPALRGHWAIGWGPGSPPGVTWPSTESIYIHMILRGGLALLAIYLALMWTLAAGALRIARTAVAERRATARALFVTIAVLAVVQAIIPLFIGAGMPHVVWILAALIFAEPAVLGRQQDEPAAQAQPQR
jgi:hypothetical protein